MGLYLPSTRIVSNAAPSNPTSGMRWCEVDSSGIPLWEWDWVWNGSFSGGKWLSPTRSFMIPIVATSTGSSVYTPIPTDLDIYVGRYDIQISLTSTQDTFNYFIFGIELRTITNAPQALIRTTNTQNIGLPSNWQYYSDKNLTFVDRTTYAFFSLTANVANTPGTGYIIGQINWGYCRP